MSDERRPGHSRLVYNKATRTTDTVRDHPSLELARIIAEWQSKLTSYPDEAVGRTGRFTLIPVMDLRILLDAASRALDALAKATP